METVYHVVEMAWHTCHARKRSKQILTESLACIEKPVIRGV